MGSEYAKLIAGMPLFRGLTAAGAQAMIDCGGVKEYAAGEQLCREGDAADGVLLTLSGKLRAYIEREGTELVVGDFGAGTVLGDVAVLCGIPRAASVRALEPSAVLFWPSESYRRMLLAHPFLSQRLFAATMRMLIEHEKSLLESLVEHRRARAG